MARWDVDPSNLVQILRETQDSVGWLPPEALSLVARELRLPLAAVRGVAGFYSFLYTEPAGLYQVLFSDNITDRMQGSEQLLQEFCHQLWVEPGKVSEDGLVRVDRTSCTGLCDQGPGLLVNGLAVGRAAPERLELIRELLLERQPLDEWPSELFEIADNIRRRHIILGSDLRPGEALRAALDRAAAATREMAANERSWREGLPGDSQGPSAVLREIELSGLRGRGGAGFTTAAKWSACRAAPADTRFVVCNADEGEPGTFKDRVLLSSYADLLFDGMTVAAFCVGAREGLLYLRGEYRYLLAALEAKLERRRAAGLLGRNLLGRDGFDFDIRIHVGAGSYVCGEESALLESMEGRRGIPRNRPPYPVTHGYLGRPTVVNNVETLCAAALVAVHGGEWFRSMGTDRSTGTKILSVAGDCARPGLYEYPFGVSVGDVLADCGAERTLAVQVSGPSGHCIDGSEFSRRIAFEDLPTAGAFTVFDDSRDMFEVARNYVEFFAHESCGFCTPCRVGTDILRGIMGKIGGGRGSLHELTEMSRLNRVLQMSAHCGLGHTACNPVIDTLKRFRPAYERRLQSLRFAPDFDLDSALAAARRATGRDDAGAFLEDKP
ncbi:MAG: NAD(P)H-dependent oxidoreductase subunit E [Gammaproteobacteria bacterium]|jgi:[NiFe] hydrogenase diaphorase moiety large subunit